MVLGDSPTVRVYGHLACFDFGVCSFVLVHRCTRYASRYSFIHVHDLYMQPFSFISSSLEVSQRRGL